MMRSYLSALVLSCTAVFLPCLAHAEPMGPVTGSGGGVSGSGTLTASSNGDGSYLIVSMTGTGVVGLIDPGAFNSNDNLLFPSGSSYVDSSGFAFNDSMGDTSFNVDIYSTSAGVYYAYIDDSDGFSQTIPITLSVSDGPSANSTGVHTFGRVRSDAPVLQNFNFSFGTAGVPAVTPEPSGLLLLGTGLLGIAGAGAIRSGFRRRKAVQL